MAIYMEVFLIHITILILHSIFSFINVCDNRGYNEEGNTSEINGQHVAFALDKVKYLYPE
jgi:hypothetical protein